MMINQKERLALVWLLQGLIIPGCPPETGEVLQRLTQRLINGPRRPNGRADRERRRKESAA
jgi:hypothetical protein